MAQIFITSHHVLTVLQLPLAHLQNLSFLIQWPERRGRTPLLFFQKLKGVTLLFGKNAQIKGIYG